MMNIILFIFLKKAIHHTVLHEMNREKKKLYMLLSAK